MQVGFRSWKRKEMDSPLEPLKETQPKRQPHFSLVIFLTYRTVRQQMCTVLSL